MYVLILMFSKEISNNVSFALKIITGEMNLNDNIRIHKDQMLQPGVLL